MRGLPAGCSTSLETPVPSDGRGCLASACASIALRSCGDHSPETRVVEPGVPHLKHIHGGKVRGLSLAIALGAATPQRGRSSRRAFARAEHNEATSRLTLPSEGAQCLVESVDVEDQPALRVAKAAEIHQDGSRRTQDMDSRSTAPMRASSAAMTRRDPR